MNEKTRVRLDSDTLRVIEQEVRDRRTPSQIRATLIARQREDAAARGTKLLDHEIVVPSLRSIQRAVADFGHLPDGPWTVEPAAPRPEDAPFLFEVLSAVMWSRVTPDGRLEAAVVPWLVALRFALEGLDPQHMYRVARLYASRSARGASTADLDSWIAATPWRSEAESDSYLAGVVDAVFDTAPFPFALDWDKPIWATPSLMTKKSAADLLARHAGYLTDDLRELLERVASEDDPELAERATDAYSRWHRQYVNVAADRISKLEARDRQAPLQPEAPK